jgi:hypothetical protein
MKYELLQMKNEDTQEMDVYHNPHETEGQQHTFHKQKRQNAEIG